MINLHCWRGELARHLTDINWSRIAADLQPFLERREEPALVIKENFLGLLLGKRRLPPARSPYFFRCTSGDAAGTESRLILFRNAGFQKTSLRQKTLFLRTLRQTHAFPCRSEGRTAGSSRRKSGLGDWQGKCKLQKRANSCFDICSLRHGLCPVTDARPCFR
jgi:hypothetical protein